MSNIFNFIKKNLALLSIIIIILITGAVLFIKAENQINSQKVELATLQQTVNKRNDQIATLAKNNSSANKQIKSLLSAPTPTPQVITRTEYQTQYVQEQQPVQNKVKQPVTYNSYGGTTLYGSDGSTCNSYGGNTVYCNGGN